jgi:hypothetical protein
MEELNKECAVACAIGLAKGLHADVFLLQCLIEVLKWFLETFIPIRL